MDDKEIVSAVRILLADKVERDNLELWFGPDTELIFTDGTLKVTAASRFSQDWLRTRYREALEASCREVLGHPAPVEFCVAAAKVESNVIAAEAPRRSSSKNGARGRCDVPVAVADRAKTAMTKSGVHPSHLAFSLPGSRGGAGRRNGRGSSDERNGRGVTTTRRRFASLDTFVISSSNRLAHASAQMVVEKPGSMSPLLLYGPAGCGKTHLLEGIWSAAHTVHRGIHAVFLSAEQFTTLFVEALRGSGLPNFRRKYRGVDLLIVDDIQFLAGKHATLVELLHTSDALSRDGKQLVFSADRSPADLGQLGPELATRLAGGMACGLEQPDAQTRIGLVHEFARRLESPFPQDVAEYVAGSITAGAREVCGAVNRIHATSRILSEPISRSLAEVALAELLRHGSKAVRLEDIERAVCDVFGLSSDSLQSGGRTKAVSSARMLAMFLARKHTRAGLSEIGQHFGRRSHSTVISAQKRVADWLSGQTDVELADKRCTMDEAIRRVEHKLCAG